MGLFVLALLGAFYVARAVVLPIILAILFSLILAPVVRGLRRLHVPRWIASGLVVAGVVAVVALVALLTFDSVGQAVTPPLAYLALTALEGSFVTPTILGQRLTLSPLVIFVGIIFWGWMWGVVGALLAVPMLASFKIVCDHVEKLRPVGELLGR